MSSRTSKRSRGEYSDEERSPERKRSKADDDKHHRSSKDDKYRKEREEDRHYKERDSRDDRYRSSREDDRHYKDREDDRYYKDREERRHKDKYSRGDRDREDDRHRDRRDDDKYYKDDKKYRDSDYKREKSSRSEKDGKTKRENSPSEEKGKPKDSDAGTKNGDLPIDISSIAATIAAAKAAMEKTKKELEKSEVKIPQTSDAVQDAIARATLKIAKKKKEMPQFTFTKETLAAETLRVKESLINRRIGREQLENEVAQPQQNKYFDPRLSTARAERDKRSFQFVTPGTYVKQGQSLRAQQWASQKNFDEKHPLNKRLFNVLNNDPVPPVEWWDKLYFPADCDHYDISRMLTEQITHYEEHPVPERCASDPSYTPTSFLTKKEKKKLRRIRRQDLQKEKQIKVMMGIEKPPEARATLTNMVRVYGTEAFEDPTKVEQMVRQQMQERLDKHLKQNEERKLTPEQKKQKKLDKLRKNESSNIQAVVFKIKDISSPLHRKNIEHTTRDGGITGCLIICEEECNLVVAEGGPRAIKKFKRLMSHRLKWDENVPDNRCDLIWEGVLQKRMFKRFRFHELKTAKEAREILEKRNAAHYWDTAVAFTPALLVD